MRQFRLVNGKDNVFDLNSDNVFVHSPDGLGVNLSSSYYGSDINFVLQSQGLSQNVIKMGIMFGYSSKNPYGEYRTLVRFLNAKPIKLQYTIDGVGNFYRDVELNELTKSELNGFGLLEETISFDCTSPWYSWGEFTASRYIDQPGDGLIYRNIDMDNNKGFYTHDYVYEEEPLDEKLKWFSIKNNSVYMGLSYGAPIELTITASKKEINNPSWYLTDEDDNVLQTDGYFVTIPLGDSLVVSSDPTNLRAELVSGDGTRKSVYNYQDMTKTNFIRVPEGDSKMHMESLLANADISYKIKTEYVTI